MAQRYYFREGQHVQYIKKNHQGQTVEYLACTVVHDHGKRIILRGYFGQKYYVKRDNVRLAKV